MKAFIWTLLFFILFIPLFGFGMPTVEQVKSRNIMTVEQFIKLEREAKENNPFAQVILGELYRVGGIGAIPNGKKAIYWLEKAAKHGNPIAEQRLSLMYLQGILVKQNTEKYKFYARKAYNDLELIVRTRQGPAELVAFAEYCLGSMYFWGIEGIVPQDLSRAFALTKEAAEYGYLFAIHRLIVMYRVGIGTAKSDALAVSWSLIPAELGDREAQYKVGMAYLTGKGLPHDDQKALSFLSMSAKQGYYQAVTKLVELKKQGMADSISEIDSRNWLNIFGEAQKGQQLFLEEKMEGQE